LGRRFDAAKWAALGGRAPGPEGPATPPTPRDPDAASAPMTGPTVADRLADLDTAPTGEVTTSRRPAGAAPVLPRFVDDAAPAGLTFIQESGGASGRLIPPVTASGGVGLLDYDVDGWLDGYLFQRGPVPPGG